MIVYHTVYSSHLRHSNNLETLRECGTGNGQQLELSFPDEEQKGPSDSH